MFYTKKGVHQAKQGGASDGKCGAVNGKKSSEQRQRQYRRGAQIILYAFSNFNTTGVMPGEKRGRASGRTIVHDEDVQAFCQNVIALLTFWWSFKKQKRCVKEAG